ncbi:hypothetical protein Anas_02946 [Armadillidium nasatum]|uniref:Uncharacterized protein n=1 Tax=Armadillidium nasatum TaxID=96803 RepID=A0A5N5TP93_9CRUS|nr:hypothetical protein Anas_02946 [Armadillidium nasatum]
MFFDKVWREPDASIKEMVLEVQVFMLLVAVASGFPQYSSHSQSSAKTGFQSRTGRSNVATNARTATNPAATGNPYGPKAYGPGLNNPYAFPPNQFQVQRALNLANAQPGLLVRVAANGEVDLTDQYGREVDVYDNFGNDLTDIYDL